MPASLPIFRRETGQGGKETAAKLELPHRKRQEQARYEGTTFTNPTALTSSKPHLGLLCTYEYIRQSRSQIIKGGVAGFLAPLSDSLD